jgi:hypothetical protein
VKFKPKVGRVVCVTHSNCDHGPDGRGRCGNAFLQRHFIVLLIDEYLPRQARDIHRTGNVAEERAHTFLFRRGFRTAHHALYGCHKHWLCGGNNIYNIYNNARW